MVRKLQLIETLLRRRTQVSRLVLVPPASRYAGPALKSGGGTRPNAKANQHAGGIVQIGPLTAVRPIAVMRHDVARHAMGPFDLPGSRLIPAWMPTQPAKGSRCALDHHQ
jgi:hypothetical protein